jgi:hypothetical protein
VTTIRVRRRGGIAAVAALTVGALLFVGHAARFGDVRGAETGPSARPDLGAAIVNGTLAPAGTRILAIVRAGAPARLAPRELTCNAAAIAPAVVVTAAHCVSGAVGGALEVVVVSTDSATGGLVTPTARALVRSVRVHPGYHPTQLRNDVAVLRLATALPATGQGGPDIHPVAPPGTPMPATVRVSGTGCSAWVRGRGCTAVDGRIRVVDVPVLDTAGCLAVVGPGRGFDAAREGCAGATSSGGTAPDACFGDSGGPVTGDGRLVGLTSFGLDGCGNRPGFFTRLDGHAAWLAEQAATGSGYWVLTDDGVATGFGDVAGVRLPAAGRRVVHAAVVAGAGLVGLAEDATVLGASGAEAGPPLAPGERAVRLLALRDAAGPTAPLVVTERGRVLGATPAGDLAGLHLNAGIVDAVSTASGRGYWLLGADGGVFAFGDAVFHGSTASLRLNAPVVGIAPTPSGGGYWLVAADGGVFAFGDAAFRGSMGGHPMNAPVVGMVAYGDGYLLVGADGGVFAFSDRPFVGSLGGSAPGRPAVAVVPAA